MRRTHQLNVALNEAERDRVRRLAEHVGLDAPDVVRHLICRADDERRKSDRPAR
jgi:hypothetical protein